ncbi:hypothetical protein C826_01116 [Helicobacter bilis WiWa]|uniref:Uncharacterized protein n=1 Tax=Helicobacter bilis WiWa TaxID=1235804 RepID=N2BL05_9HELI|nr:hypothetical protein C826_01116 [Helicobacter bilis WiWa]
MLKCKVIIIALLLFILFVREAVLTKLVKTLQFVTMLESNRKEALFLTCFYTT